MCLSIAVGLLLLVMLAGYLVLLKAGEQQGKTKIIGQIISWIVIVTALVGMLCTTAALHCRSGKYSYCKKGGKSQSCNYSGKSGKNQCSYKSKNQGSDK